MTEDRVPQRRRPGPLPTLLAALAVFAVAFEFLAFQLSAGKDPAVGSAGVPVNASGKTPPAKKVVITKVVPAGGATSGASASSSSGAPVASPPITTSSS